MTLEYKDKRVFADLGAERVVAAEGNGEKIAVEIKSFLGRSIMDDLKAALGQYVLYENWLMWNLIARSTSQLVIWHIVELFRIVRRFRCF